MHNSGIQNIELAKYFLEVLSNVDAVVPYKKLDLNFSVDMLNLNRCHSINCRDYCYGPFMMLMAKRLDFLVSSSKTRCTMK